jgi:hypothetical protein
VGVVGALQDVAKRVKAIKNTQKSALTGFVAIDFRIFHQLPSAHPDMAQ